MDLCRCRKAHRNHLTSWISALGTRIEWGKVELTFRQDLVGFSFTDTFYCQELFLGCESYCFDRMVSRFDQLVGIGC